MELKTKRCPKCKQEKFVFEYNKSTYTKSKLRSRCRSCEQEDFKIQYHSDPEKHKKRAYKWEKENRVRRNSYHRCLNQLEHVKEPQRKRMREWAERNRDYIRVKHKEWRIKNSVKLRKYWETEYGKRRAYYIHKADKRKRNLECCTPSWANHRYIEMFYELAKMEEERTGRPVHVDHIIPLKGKNVCGLHWEHNLQLLFAEDNLRKANRTTEAA